jgi:hypothetical protein
VWESHLLNCRRTILAVRHLPAFGALIPDTAQKKRRSRYMCVMLGGGKSKKVKPYLRISGNSWNNTMSPGARIKKESFSTRVFSNYTRKCYIDQFNFSFVISLGDHEKACWEYVKPLSLGQKQTYILRLRVTRSESIATR